MKNLKNLLDGNKLKSDIQFKNLCINSNDIDPGDVFVALKNSFSFKFCFRFMPRLMGKQRNSMTRYRARK